MPEKKAEGKGILGEIFRAMEYNENQVENFSTILNWLSIRDHSLTSIVNGDRLGVSVSKGEHKFLVGQTPVSVSYLSPKQLRESLPASKPASVEKKLDDKEIAARLEKLGALIEKQKSDLSRVEALGCGVPVWQVETYDQPQWKAQLRLANESTSPGLCGTVVMRLSREGYSTMGRLLQLLALLLQTDERVVLVMSGEGPEDAALLLPPAYLLDVLNKAKIRQEPIDLLLLDHSSEESWEVLRQTAAAGQVLIWGNLGPFPNLNTLVSSGVLAGTSGSGIEGRGAHYVLDSSADTQTALDSISADVWCSGTKVNSRTRVILFVHQPIVERIIELFERRLAALKTSPDLHLRASDFIKRPVVGIDSKTARAQGVKTIPADSDFSVPTLVYDVGPSSEWMSGQSRGHGHVLFLIPYRSPAELLSLANNYGDENEVFIYTASAALAKQIALNIKGTPVYVNQRGGKPNEVRPFLENINNLGLLSGQTTRATAPLPQTNNQDEFGRAVQGGGKALSAWSALGTETRYSLGARVLTRIQSEMNASDTPGLLPHLLKLAGRLFTETGTEGSDRLVSRQYKPFGLSAIILVKPELMSPEKMLLPILATILKGNVAIVVTVCSLVHAVDPALIAACEAVLPPGVVHFLQSPTLPQALEQLSKEGKVSLAWIIHAGNAAAPALNDIPLNGFGRVIVDEISSLEKLIVSHGKQAEIGKAIYL